MSDPLIEELRRIDSRISGLTHQEGHTPFGPLRRAQPQSLWSARLSTLWQRVLDAIEPAARRPRCPSFQ